MPLSFRRMLEHSYPICAEIEPDKGPGREPESRWIETASQMKPDAFSVVDSPLGIVRPDPVASSVSLMQKTGIECMPHLACRDRNAAGLRSALMASHQAGIRAILALTGDAGKSGKHGRPVFELSSVTLIEMMAGMNKDGYEFFIGAACNPNAQLDFELKRCEQKARAGCHFFVSQPVYDALLAERFYKELKSRTGKPLVVGMLPLTSHHMAEKMSKVPGIRIAEELLHKLRASEDQRTAGLEHALELARQLKQYSEGALVMPFADPEVFEAVKKELLK